jgi:methyl coenzyme M reductase gamma subunit
MAKHEKITGIVIYENLEGGIWAIKDEKGRILTPVNMPEQLKHKGKKVKVTIKRVDMMTMTMFGDPVKIISFETLAP